MRSLEAGALTLARIGEPISGGRELLASFDELGPRPGARVGLSAHGDASARRRPDAPARGSRLPDDPRWRWPRTFRAG